MRTEVVTIPALASAAIFAILVLLTLGEALVLRRRERRTGALRETWVSVCIGIGFFSFAYAIEFLGLSQFAWLQEHSLLHIPLDSWWGVLLLFLGVELCYYWYHRCSHKIHWFWASHSTHHTSRDFNISAAYRVSWVSGLSGSFLFYVPLVWLGFHPAIIFSLLSATLMYQVLLHTELIPHLGILEKVFNTPANHRVHHRLSERCRDRNFGNVLIVFDRLFGTYAEEQSTDLPEYGLVNQLDSRNVFVIMFHEWHRMLRDALQARNAGAALRQLFGKP